MTGDPSALEALRSAEATPIAQLRPDIDGAEARVVDGVVTITWPYSVVTGSVAFILAEPDFRLRRDKGQLRIEFHGAAGKSLADSGIGGGDQVRISLEGAKWESHQARTRLPGSTLDWQLKFTNRLLLNVRRAESEGPSVIDIDAPEEQEPQLPSEDGPVREATPPVPELQLLEDNSTPVARTAASSLPAKRLASSAFEPEEYASPAFLKRARVSYGSLFEGGLDIFDETNEKKSKQQRRPRFSMNNTVWRYSSRSPSPELDQPLDDESPRSNEPVLNNEAHVAAVVPTVSPSQASMKDEGCQTQDLYFSPSTEIQATGESRPVAPAVSPTPKPTSNETPNESNHVSFQTPSRTLFAHENRQHDAHRPEEQLLPTYGRIAQQHHDFGLGARDSHDDARMYNVPPTAGPAMSTGALSEGTAASDYPIATFGHHNFATTTSNIDPSLQFPPEMSAQEHLYYAAPPPHDMEWHDEAGPAEYPSAPLRNSDHQPMAVDSSPSRGQSLEAEPQPASTDDSVRNSHRSTSRDDDALRDHLLREAEEQPTGRDDGDKEYEDGGDIPGEDYDLRNYDHAKADDQSESEDQAPSRDDSDVEQQAIGITDESDESEEEEEEEDEIEEEQQVQERAHMQVRDDEAAYDEESAESMEDGLDAEEDAFYAGSDDGNPLDAEAEEYDVEDDYYEGEEYEEEYDEEDEEEDDDHGAHVSGPPPRVSAPEEPVFISLLSDSEDEEQPPATQATSSIPSAQLTGPSKLGETESETVADSAVDMGPQIEGKPSAEAEMEAGDTQESPGQAAAEEDETLDPGDRPLSPQPAQAVSLEASADVARGAKDKDASRLSSPEPEDLRLAQNEAEAEVPAGIIGPAPSVPMDLDESLDVGEDAHRLIDRDVQQHTDHSKAFTIERTAGDAADVTPNSDAPVMDVMDTEHLEKEDAGAEMDESPANPDTVMQHGSDEQPNDSHRVQPVSDAVTSSTVAEFREDAGPDGQPAASEALVDAVVLEMMATDEKAQHRQLPSRNEPQPKGDAPMLLQQQTQPSQEDEDALAAEAQIITEYEEYQTPAKPGAFGAGDAGPGSGAAQPAPSLAPDEVQTVGDDQTKEDDETRDEQVRVEVQEPEPLITAKSLRSRALRTTRPNDITGGPYEDPSIRLAKAPPPETGQEEQPGSPTILYATGKKSDRFDPSILLAKAPAPEIGHEKQPNSAAVPRTTRSKSSQPESSLLLAQASLAQVSAGDAAHPEDGQPPNTLRVTRSMADQAEPMAHSTKTSPSSTKGTRHHATTPEPTRELRSKPNDQAPPKTPDRVVESMLKSPSVAGSVPEDEDNAALKRQLQRALRTSLPDFLSLRTLRTSLSKTVDILAVCTSTPPQPHRPKHGPRDYMLELILTDPSTAPSGVSVAHVFRPHQASLPVVHAGDIVLLRRMQVVSVKGRGFGVRVGDASAWAVFEKGDDEMLPQIKGPPVEVSAEEVEYAQGLRHWWAMQDEKALAKVDKATQKASQAGKDDSK